MQITGFTCTKIVWNPTQAGYQGFLSEDRIAQDGGELIAAWLIRRHSPLLDYVKQKLTAGDDAITYLARPLLGEPSKTIQLTFDNRPTVSVSLLRTSNRTSSIMGRFNESRCNFKQTPIYSSE